MSKSLLLKASSTILLFFLLVVPVQAHVLEIDNSIRATLHIEPADDPGANEPSYFHLTFEDKNNKLDLTKCNCSVTIVSGSSTIFSSPLSASGFTNGPLASSFEYTFPAKGVYTFTISGEPVTAGSFQPFTLHYDIRVDRDSGQSISLFQRVIGSHLLHTEHWAHIIIIGGGIFVGIYLTVQDSKKNKRYNQANKIK